MRYLYIALMTLALPFLLIRLYFRGQKSPKYRKNWAERLGFMPFKAKNCIWIHAVSLGETIAAVPLIKQLLAQYPDREIVVTSTTPTGRDRVKSALGDTVKYGYIPFDLPFLWNVFFFRIKPIVMITMETELWPNLFFYCAQKKIPVLVANARLSERSMEKYQIVKSLTREMLGCITQVLAQTPEDKERFVSLGLDPARCQVVGNVKFDLSPNEGLAEKFLSLRKSFEGRLVWIIASTHSGEEKVLFQVYKHIKVRLPNLLLVCAPRHPERFSEVEGLAQEEGLHLITRTSGAGVTEDVDVLLINTMGELLYYYGAADIAFVGGSLVPVGGHNLLEPAVLGLPILTGPHVENFVAVTAMLVQAEAVIQIDDGLELETVLLKLAKDPARRAKMGKNGQAVVAKNRGATERHLKVISYYLNQAK
jgi:3-deoxy-D-manno-octulosonic-acid transferase